MPPAMIVARTATRCKVSCECEKCSCVCVCICVYVCQGSKTNVFCGEGTGCAPPYFFLGGGNEKVGGQKNLNIHTAPANYRYCLVHVRILCCTALISSNSSTGIAKQ